VDVSVAGSRVDASLLWGGLVSFARLHSLVLRYYDQVCEGYPRPAEGINLELLGRVLFVDRSLTAEEAGQLLEANFFELLTLVPEDARLSDADPAVEGGLYDVAEKLHRSALSVNRRISPTVVSAALALLRPSLFPILNQATRLIYQDAAERAWHETGKAKRPFSGRTYWPVIRYDVVAAQPQLDSWRHNLESSNVDAEQWLARVSDVRLWGVATQSLTAGRRAGS
jgi:hypothetical protein